MPKYPSAKIEKYKKIKNLAKKSNNAGERAAATERLKEMRANYPGIEQEAFPPPKDQPKNPKTAKTSNTQHTQTTYDISDTAYWLFYAHYLSQGCSQAEARAQAAQDYNYFLKRAAQEKEKKKNYSDNMARRQAETEAAWREQHRRGFEKMKTRTKEMLRKEQEFSRRRKRGTNPSVSPSAENKTSREEESAIATVSIFLFGSVATAAGVGLFTVMAVVILLILSQATTS